MILPDGRSPTEYDFRGRNSSVQKRTNGSTGAFTNHINRPILVHLSDGTEFRGILERDRSFEIEIGVIQNSETKTVHILKHAIHWFIGLDAAPTSKGGAP
jgi:hypothetical protein